MKTVIKIALIALLWATVVNRGTLGTIDTVLRLQIAHAWWTGTEEVDPTVRPESRYDNGFGVMGAGGKRLIPFDLGQSFLMLPGDWLGTQLHQFFPKTSPENLRHLVVCYLIFVPLNVAAVVACFWLLRAFNFEEWIAGLTAITWLLCTTVLHYAQQHQQNNQVLLFAIIGYAAALAYTKRGNSSFALLSGLAASAALLVRASGIIHVVTILLFLLGCVAYQSRDKLKVIRSFGLWIVGFLPLGLLGSGLNYIRYGSFLTTGQEFQIRQIATDPIYAGLPGFPDSFPFINEPYVGIIGVLFSPAKSIFIYDPLLLPCLVLGIVLWKKLSPYIQLYLVASLLNLALHIMLTSRLAFWAGEDAWGARYHVTSVHLLLIPLIAVLIQYIPSAKGFMVWLMRGILALALLVQIASVTMHYQIEVTQALRVLPSKSRYDQFRLGQRFTNIMCRINTSYAEQCIENESIQPPRSIPGIYLFVWRGVLAFTAGATVWFVYTAWKVAEMSDGQGLKVLQKTE